MEKYRSIPQGYMTVGEVAKKMGVTVRTLQYYDKEGLLSPSSESVGGRRLYTDKDVVKLHQVLSMKHLGFSLDDIKNRLSTLNTPTEVANVLAEQAGTIRKKIETLSVALYEIETLKTEVLLMQSVDFKKYADIIVNLQMQNEFYWIIKHFDDKTLDHFRQRFDMDSGLAMMETFTRLNEEAMQLQMNKVSPASKEGQEFANMFWNMIMKFTDGDMSLLPNLIKVGTCDAPDDEWKQKQTIANDFIESALDVYLTNLGLNPFEEVPK